MTLSSLLPLFAAIPLLLAGLSVVFRRRWLDRTMLLALPGAALVGAVSLIVYHQSHSVLAHSVGAFSGVVAIPFVSDTFTAIMLAVTSFATLVTSVFLLKTGEDRFRFATALILLLAGGVNGALLTGDLFNLFVFVEVMLMPSYALIAITGTWRRLGVGRSFVIVNLVTSTILLMGVGLVYGAAGTVNLAALAGLATEDPMVGLAITVVLTALAIKGGLVPVHGWLPSTYPMTSPGIMALFSALHTKVALYAIFRIYSVAFGEPAPWMPVLLVLVLATMLVGAFSTMASKTLRGALAFQMIAGVGHILVAIVVMTEASLAAGMFYMVHHIITMGGLILASGALENTYGNAKLGGLSGLLGREKLLAILFALGLASLVGLPPTSGLWGKAGLVFSAAAAEDASGLSGGWIAGLTIGGIIAASIISLIGLQRVWSTLFFGHEQETYRPDDPRTGRGEPQVLTRQVRCSARLLAPATVMIAASVALFFAAGLVLPLFETAAHDLMDPSSYIKAVLG
ncbi:proton-conducting transporter transmembrane domain-containing protein [Zhihengliuella salsuginis]|uniref:Cation:proton antiporter n=1 Tax=Zhihengliuella salsuginis TaxID=578222 RepID=A0ABQ3GG00_9MICC|nr:proton-conducting transporter membrane subunit [Zhihengliuella salsuginis]GHD04906.1 cation:proton antiporter [Zhihengliuella salsuginis]